MKKLKGASIRGMLATIPFSLSSRLLPKNFNIKINKTIILSVVLYECKTWSLIKWRM
jgi:hypothetical protein